jgi:type IV secretory pathway TraG/TraD family ATPase VirD4
VADLSPVAGIGPAWGTSVTPTKLLIGQILAVFAIMVLGVWAATQWAAAMLAYQPELGPAWFELRGLPLYRPWALFAWWSITGSAGSIMSSTVCSPPPN